MIATIAARKWWIIAWIFLAPSLAQADDSLSEQQVAFFEKRIRPVLVEHCYECHSASAEEPEGGLRLDFREFSIRGGGRGPAIVPGQSDQSLLIEAVR